ncbi:energy-coupling factor transporter ATPase [Desulfolucanica intricata]|uniref:energy-coupling factor transporter ATPase n=1 Tax=Desulfolucanica intricata TaxID=1285191 RepID=UPI000AD5E969|nr:energy-coupling factor transporter ATPase [Desulfolucanica intricata]
MEIQSLNDVSFEVAKGEMVAIVGATGSGKSTLVQHLNGLLLPGKGEVLINQISTCNKDFRRKLWRIVGLVFQYPEHQLFEETVYADVAFGPKNLSLPDEEVCARVKLALKQMGLNYEYIKGLSPLKLSGGEKRRVAIAGVLAIQPEIIVLDEPTAGLDPIAGKKLLNLLKELQEQKKITVIIVTHNLKEVALYADRMIVLNRGRVVFDGVPREAFIKGSDLFGIGLGMPPVTELMLKLVERGKPVRKDVLTVSEAVTEILRVFK